jgi:ankyrin repeat protein
MELAPLAFDAPLSAYVAQAEGLLAGWQAGDETAISVFRRCHPRFLDTRIPWLQRQMTADEVRATPIDRDEALLALARSYDFADWQRLAELVEAVRQPASPVARFERAVDAVIDGEVATLRQLLQDDPELVRARSTRVTHFDPPVHGAMLLHYVAANGVEGYRQRSPKNAAEVVTILLDAGADPDALCDSYGSRCTTMALLVSSTPPARAGVQVPVLNVLIDRGASVGPRGEGHWTSPLMTALVFGFTDAARALVERGAPIDTLAAAAGLGRADDVRRMLPSASADDRHRALALASQLGHSGVVGVLLDAGEDPNRYNLPGTHAHSPPLHQAIAAGHLEVVKVLVERGARLDLKDTIYHGTPLAWAKYCDKPAIAEYLTSLGAP